MEEKNEYLTEQIITYLGNKRKLIQHIEYVIKEIISETGKERFVCADLFSGSGIVARLLKKYSDVLYTNDMESYSRIINECYLSNAEKFDENKYAEYRKMIDERSKHLMRGIISNNYAPEDVKNIKPGERVFYTTRNAMYIDTVRNAIDSVEQEYKKYFIAPLLYEASVHANTSGVFKGFYKDSESDIGKFGGNAENCLDRISSDIILPKPIFSNFNSDITVFQEDTNQLVKRIKNIDIAYIDPPYNQHAYGSNYFMLNTILKNEIGENISKVSGIPSDWNRSSYNKKNEINETFSDLINNLDAKYIIVSYNSEGFLKKEQIEEILGRYGTIKTISINYNTFRGCRNLENRNLYVNEYIFVLSKH